MWNMWGGCCRAVVDHRSQIHLWIGLDWFRLFSKGCGDSIAEEEDHSLLQEME